MFGSGGTPAHAPAHPSPCRHPGFLPGLHHPESWDPTQWSWDSVKMVATPKMEPDRSPCSGVMLPAAGRCQAQQPQPAGSKPRRQVLRDATCQADGCQQPLDGLTIYHRRNKCERGAGSCRSVSCAPGRCGGWVLTGRVPCRPDSAMACEPDSRDTVCAGFARSTLRRCPFARAGSWSGFASAAATRMSWPSLMGSIRSAGCNGSGTTREGVRAFLAVLSCAVCLKGVAGEGSRQACMREAAGACGPGTALWV